MTKDNLAQRHNQKIACDVKSCRFYGNDEIESYCTLPSIKVSCTEMVNNKLATICDSYKTKR